MRSNIQNERIETFFKNSKTKYALQSFSTKTVPGKMMTSLNSTILMKKNCLHHSTTTDLLILYMMLVNAHYA